MQADKAQNVEEPIAARIDLFIQVLKRFMKVQLLGTTGYRPSDTRHTSCFMLPELGIVFDAGTGMFRVRDHLQTEQLDLLLSHVHLDHVAGLTYLLYILAEKPAMSVNVFAEADKIETIQTHLLCEKLFPAPLPCKFRTLPVDRKFSLTSGAEIVWFPLAHPGGSVGYRLEFEGKSMAYVTDTTAMSDAEYVEKIRGVDLLIHECNFPDGREDWAKLTGHSCATPVAQVAKKAEVRQLVLVHADPMSNVGDPIGLEGIRDIFPAAILAEDKMELDF